MRWATWWGGTGPTGHPLYRCREVLPLLPGDIIATGTPSGVGRDRKPPVWMRPGDRIDTETDLAERLGLGRPTVRHRR